MAHQEQIEYCLKIKNKYPNFFQKRFVLDVGSLDVNGKNHYLFEDCLYLGVDVAEGRNVDIICLGSELKLPDATFDTIISTECFEHDRYYHETLKNIYRMLKPGGLFIFTCATIGRAEHGTRRTSPDEAPLLVNYDDWHDYYKNITENDIREVLDLDDFFSEYGFEVNDVSHDLYFYGIKTNTLKVRDDYSFIIHNNRLQIELENQIAKLNQVVRNQKSEILQLHSQVATVLNSRSWRITKPLRTVGTYLRRYGFAKLKIRTKLWRLGAVIYRHLPLNQKLKLRLKDCVYRNFGVLFANAAGYNIWKLMHGQTLTSIKEIPHPSFADPNLREPFSFPVEFNPEVSIIIPVYNKSDYTYTCLQSIYQNFPQISFEIVVVDDCSTDDTLDLLATIGGITVIHNETNLGFVYTTNNGAKAARGKYLLFLNNDTIVKENWLDELYAVLSIRNDIGLVGSQLIYSNGLLQESGCLICQDGSSIPLGRLKDPLTPEYSCLREVDFCSGASILVRKAEFEEVGGFDSAYAPAYYEDPDLALKLRVLGKKTYVQPLSKVIHYEKVSYGEKSYSELTNRNKKK